MKLNKLKNKNNESKQNQIPTISLGDRNKSHPGRQFVTGKLKDLNNRFNKYKLIYFKKELK